MKNEIEIAGMTLTLELGPIEKDHDAGSQWCNGTVILPDGRRVSCGGGWIESEEAADQENERLGIAGGLRQGASYPNEVKAGDFTPYAYGEDETGWQEVIMPLTLATKQHFHAVSHWSEMQDADDMARITYAMIQEGFQKIAELSPEPLAAQYEIVFDNGGGATLQNHDGTVVINYDDMEQLAHDVRVLDGGDDPASWDGIEPEGFISDEQFAQHAPNGGYYAIQLDPEYRFNWPDPDDIGWNNVEAFLRAFRG